MQQGGGASFASVRRWQLRVVAATLKTCWAWMSGEKDKKMPRHDWILLAVAAAGGKPVSPVQLQKALFLIANELPNEVPPGFYQFRPYNYGPFDGSIYSDAEKLEAQGLLKIETQENKSWSSYVLTAQGQERAKQIANEVPSKAVGYLSAVLAWMQRVGFRQMLRSIYSKYPNYAVNSVFKG